MMTTFTPAAEVCTATLHQPSEVDEAAHVGPVHFGFYPAAKDDSKEIWLEQEGHRVHIDARFLKDVIKELRRTAMLAKELAK